MSHASNTFFSPGFPPPPPHPLWGGIRHMFDRSPILTILGGIILVGCLEENHLLEPALILGFVCLVFHFMSPRPRLRGEVPHSPPPPPPPPPSPIKPFETQTMPSLASAGTDLSMRVDYLEKQFSQIHSAGQELFKRTAPLVKPRSRSILAIFSFFAGLGSLSIPLALLSFILCFSYLNHAEISPVFLHVFNAFHFDQILFHLKFVDFDFFATFFGIVLIPSLFLVMVSLGISIRTLFKRQRGFFLAFFATGLFFISFLSLVGAWSGLIHGARRWQQDWHEVTFSSYGTAQNHVDYFQKKFEDSGTSFWKRFIAIKALKKINTPEAYQALFQGLDQNHAILQQLILRQLEGQITLDQASRIEALLAETPDRRFHEVGIRLLSTIPDKEMTLRLLNMSVPLPPEVLLNRFTEEDVPQLWAKLQEPQNRQKSAIFAVLCTLDEAQALKSLTMLASAQDEESQRLVLRWIERNPIHPQRNTLLNQLAESSFASIHFPAKQMLERDRKKSSKASKSSKRLKRGCRNEKD